MKKKTLVFGIGSVVMLIVLALIFTRGSADSFETLGNFNGEIKIYKSMLRLALSGILFFK